MKKPLNARSPSVRRTQPKCKGGVTEQHHKAACDINKIMAKYQKTGVIEHINNHAERYGNVSGADFKTAQDLIAEQTSVFYELPAYARDAFDNDPANYLDLVMTDEGIEELRAILHPSDDPKEPEAEPETASDGEESVSDTVT